MLPQLEPDEAFEYRHEFRKRAETAESALAALRSQLAAAEADRATWQQRATSAERRVEELRGEVVALRRALVGALLPLEALNIAVQWELAESVKAEIADAVSKGREALNATSQSAKLGALIAAALAWRGIDRSIPFAGHIWKAEKALQAAADAVLASEVRT